MIIITTMGDKQEEINKRGDRMSIFSRILLAFYAACLTVISFIAMIVALWPKVFVNIYDYMIDAVLAKRYVSFGLFIVAFIMFVVSVIFLTTGIRNSRDKKAVTKHTNIGDIKISLDTIENLALTASRKLNGVKEAKASVYKRKDEENVSIVIKTIVLPEVNIPVLSEDIQHKVKKVVEESSGVGVNTVKVLVENIYSGYRSRVE